MLDIMWFLIGIVFSLAMKSLNKWIEKKYPKRTWEKPWVSLTDDEIDQGLLRSDYALKTAEAWRAGVVFAMTKLKEKNT